ncbi:iron-sulfur cluster biosynthesis protein [Paucilactobacillus suebicus]|uniref:Iron-sulfur cluster biosynthesis protein n=1 Tax=Paucilactobacillus suebicus DSM 5007 = KCTC 3549 TaxID=1423807 RepID=A0A0R1W5Y6_9LACO|nr:iron-sulfur cluster biosynthesis protein [Paucilactobacillus suebicus]KRM13214.1 hypothetical protein FD16_GL001359 [Paucilactobacillus suebicus DSM 5007 = KCTC 3549]
MVINVTDSASQWFQNEMGLNSGMGVRFFGKVYGKTPVHDGFSLGMVRDDHPTNPVVDEVKDGVHYFVDELDEWFFRGYDLTIEYDEKTDGPKYEYISNGELDK